MPRKSVHRQRAIANKEKFYFTGEPCRRGHIAKRKTSSKLCVECIRERSAERFQRLKFNADFMAKLALYKKRHRVKNRDSLSEYSKSYRRKNPLVFTKFRAKTYGLSLDQYFDLCVLNHHRCFICGSTCSSSGNGCFRIDHSHQSGAVRGLLCNGCNVGLGSFRDDPKILQSAIEYLSLGIDWRDHGKKLGQEDKVRKRTKA